MGVVMRHAARSVHFRISSAGKGWEREESEDETCTRGAGHRRLSEFLQEL